MGSHGGLAIGLAVALQLSAASGLAQPAEQALPSPLTLEVVTRHAREHRAEIKVARERAHAGWAGAEAAGRPPDPMVMTSLDHLPLPDPMGADVSIMVQQSVPLSGELGARVRRAEWAARALEEDEKTVRLDVELDAAQAFMMLAEDQSMRALVDRQLTLVGTVEKLVQVQLTTGKAELADLLRIGLERARLEVRRDNLDAKIKADDAMLDATLGRVPDTAVPVCTLPQPGPEPPPGAALAKMALGARPELASMGRRIRAADEDVEVMRHMRFPMGIFGLGAAYTMSDGPGLMVSVGISLPIWAGEYDAAISEAKAMASMGRVELEAMQTMVQGSVVAARERVEAARSLEHSIRTKLLPLGEQVTKALLSSYATGGGSVVAVLEGLQSSQMIEMEHIAALAELGRARAQLARQSGTPLEAAPANVE